MKNQIYDERKIIMNNKLYIDFHILQTVPPSCVNRDDTGSPKTAVYGGATRARVSSQAWKHAMRLMFHDIFPKEDIGIRTKHIVSLVANEISALNPGADAEKIAIGVLELAGLTVKDPKKGTDALFFMSVAQAKALATLAIEDCKDKKMCREALLSTPSVDMVLFGRMVASDPSLNYDAVSQVAHSISTHAVHNEYDYFTAVDDCAPKDNAGAGHLGTVEFDSATLYRYATINVSELYGQLGSETTDAVRGFAEAMIRSMPTGKQNTFANRTLPDYVYVTIRNDQPVNLCGAFEKPIQPSPEGYAVRSWNKLMEYADRVYSEYAAAPEFAMSIGDESREHNVNLSQFLDLLTKEVEKYMPENGAIK